MAEDHKGSRSVEGGWNWTCPVFGFPRARVSSFGSCCPKTFSTRKLVGDFPYNPFACSKSASRDEALNIRNGLIDACQILICEQAKAICVAAAHAAYETPGAERNLCQNQ